MGSAKTALRNKSNTQFGKSEVEQNKSKENRKPIIKIRTEINTQIRPIKTGNMANLWRSISAQSLGTGLLHAQPQASTHLGNPTQAHSFNHQPVKPTHIYFSFSDHLHTDASQALQIWLIWSPSLVPADTLTCQYRKKNLKNLLI